MAFVLVLNQATAVAQQYGFRHYNRADGLTNLAILHTLQDQTGYLWAGTENGLFRYNGTRFEQLDKGDGLPGVCRIDGLAQAADGTLWVVTCGRVAAKIGDRFVASAATDISPLRDRSTQGDRSGGVYIGTAKGLLQAHVVTDGSRTRINVERSQWPDAQGPISGIYVESKGTVWFGCGDRLCRNDAGDARASVSTGRLPAAEWQVIKEDSKGRLWLRSPEHLYRYDQGNARFECLDRGLPVSSNPDLSFDSDGKALVATNVGLAREEQDGWEIVNTDKGLLENDVSSILLDRENSLWLGLNGGGLARWIGRGEWASWMVQDGLPSNSTWGIADSGDGRIWVGTDGGLAAIDVRTHRVTKRTPSDKKGQDRVTALAVETPRDLWVGGFAAHLRHLDTRSGVMRNYELPGLQAGHYPISKFLIDRKKHFWVVTRAALFRRAGLGDHARFEKVSVPFPNGTKFFDLAEDGNQTLWLSSSVGLLQYKDSKWTRYGAKDGLLQDALYNVAVGSDGSIWVSYWNPLGIAHLTFTSGHIQVENIAEKNGLASNNTVSLGIDSRGWIWQGTDSGVSLFRYGRWEKITKDDGLVWDDCDAGAFFASGETVWIGTSRGLAQYKPDFAHTEASPPTPIVTRLRMTGQGRGVEMNFSALTFRNESGISFFYLLSPWTDRWEQAQNRQVTLDGLSPGKYKFALKVQNAAGIWSTKPLVTEFVIQARWWQTLAFKVVAGLTVLLTFWLGFRHRTQRLIKDKEHLETAVQVRTRELEREKRRVEEASKAKSDFLANMSHEIRTPMNGILGMAAILMDTELNSDQKECAETVMQSGHILLSIINDVLDLSKIEAGKMTIEQVEFDLHEICQQTVRMLETQAFQKGLSLELQYPADLKAVLFEGDPTRIRQILINLANNAVKFTPSGSVRLAVTSEPENFDGEDSSLRKIRMEVRDTGVGIAKDVQQQLFSKFTQADSSTTRKFGGTGLGLAISKELTELMGGAIGISSEPDCGSTFHVELPLRISGSVRPQLAALADGLAADAPDAESTTFLDVLLVEDNVVNQKIALHMLRKLGCAVDIASNGEEAIERTMAKQYDCIFMDCQMPVMDGYQATEAIRQKEDPSRRVPIVALTAHAMAGDRSRCLAVGMDDYIAKPLRKEQIAEALQKWAAVNLPATNS